MLLLAFRIKKHRKVNNSIYNYEANVNYLTTLLDFPGADSRPSNSLHSLHFPRSFVYGDFRFPGEHGLHVYQMFEVYPSLSLRIFIGRDAHV